MYTLNVYVHSFIFEYYLISDVNQLEDPRLQWRDEQSRMLKDYLVVANEDLAVRTMLLCCPHFVSTGLWAGETSDQNLVVKLACPDGI